MELQQTPEYLSYLSRLGWNVCRVQRASYVWRTIPLAGNFAKIQRADVLPDSSALISSFKLHHIRTIALEPSQAISQEKLSAYARELKGAGFHISTSQFLATKTIIVDLTHPLTAIFSNFTDAKRRAVRKAQKNGVFVVQTSSIKDVINTKNISAGFLGFITTHGIRQMCETLKPADVAGLLAYEKNNITNPIGCILLVFSGKTAYYWIAGATHRGKKLFAPSLLIWEAIQRAKNHGSEGLDFLGVWDERMPNQNNEWKGFTKFKEGFGGRVEYFPIATLHKST